MDSCERRKVFIALDKGAAPCERAFYFYLNKFYKKGDQLLLAHIVEPSGIPPPTLAHGPTRCREEWDAIMKHMEDVAKDVTQEYEKRCEEHDIPYMSIWAAGSAGQGICDLAKTEGADVILIGNRGLGSIRRTLLGSVTDYVVQHSEVAVMIVPPP